MAQALACEDTDLIPKVPDAGKIFEDAEEPYQLMHNGMKLTRGVYGGKMMEDMIRGFRGHHEPQEERVFYEVLKCMPPGAVMIELGSFWAYYSLWFAQAVPQAKNYLVEPSKERLALSRKHFLLNKKEGVFVHAGIGKPNGVVINKDMLGALDLGIDELLEIIKVDQVNLLHADIQSSECAMLISAIKSVAHGKIDYFFISTHCDTHLPCLAILKAYDYSIIAEHTIEEGYMPDGLIVAKRKGAFGPNHVEISKVPKGHAIWNEQFQTEHK